MYFETKTLLPITREDYFEFVYAISTNSIILANVNSRSRSLYAIARPSVCRLSVCRL